MGLRDELEEWSPGGNCSVSLLLNELDKDMASELADLIDDLTVSSSSLARLTKTKGWRVVGAWAFSRHRRKDCKCR